MNSIHVVIFKGLTEVGVLETCLTVLHLRSSKNCKLFNDSITSFELKGKRENILKIVVIFGFFRNLLLHHIQS